MTHDQQCTLRIGTDSSDSEQDAHNARNIHNVSKVVKKDAKEASTTDSPRSDEQQERSGRHNSVHVYSGPVSLLGAATPCGHNNWDNARVKKKAITLVCRDCDVVWKLPHPIQVLCPEFHEREGFCSLGVSCPYLHVHRFKSKLRSPNHPSHVPGSKQDLLRRQAVAMLLEGRPPRTPSKAVAHLVNAFIASGAVGVDGADQQSIEAIGHAMDDSTNNKNSVNYGNEGILPLDSHQVTALSAVTSTTAGPVGDADLTPPVFMLPPPTIVPEAQLAPSASVLLSPSGRRNSSLHTLSDSATASMSPSTAPQESPMLHSASGGSILSSPIVAPVRTSSGSSLLPVTGRYQPSQRAKWGVQQDSQAE